MLGQASGQLLRDFFAERRAQYRQRRATVALGGALAVDTIPDPIPAGEAVELDPLPLPPPS